MDAYRVWREDLNEYSPNYVSVSEIPNIEFKGDIPNILCWEQSLGL